MEAVQIDFLRDIPQDEYWYFATPYTQYPGDIELACIAAAKGAGRLIAEGIQVFSPIAHFHTISIAAGMAPTNYKIWMTADEPFMRRAYGLIVYKMPTWGISKGVQIEIKEFEDAGKPIEYVEVIL